MLINAIKSNGAEKDEEREGGIRALKEVKRMKSRGASVPKPEAPGVGGGDINVVNESEIFQAPCRRMSSRG